MLKVSYENKEYKFPIMNPIKCNSYLYGFVELDNNWRELDYKNGGHSLGITATSYFEVPKNLFKKLYESDVFYAEQIIDEIEDGIISKELPVINFDLGIDFTKIFDFKTYKSVLIGNIKTHFPRFRDLENLKLDANIIENSTLNIGYFNYEPTLKAVNFGEIKDNTIHLICKAAFETYHKIKGEIEIDVWLPINLYFEAGVYADSFPDKSIEERLTEVRDCFATIYDISEYNLVEKVISEKAKRVRIQFEPKK